MTAKRALVLVLFLSIAISVTGEIGFSAPDLSIDNRLLFKGTTEAPGFGSYDTLFTAGLGGKTGKIEGLKQLSFFPEKITVLSGSAKFQVQNRFGVFRSDEKLGGLFPVAGFTSFAGGGEVLPGRLIEARTSPDGRYIATVSPVSNALGDLYLYDTTTGKNILISKGLEQPSGNPPVLWSPDGRFFIFARTGSLYYFSVLQLQENRVLDESYRSIGSGAISSVDWCDDNSLFFIAGDLVWRIRAHELFTRSLYSGFMQAGTVAGKLPFGFDPNFDTFKVSPDGRKVLLNKGGRNIFLYSLGVSGESTGEALNLPYLLLPSNSVVRDAVWSADDVLTVLVASRVRGAEKISVYRLSGWSGSSVFTLMTEENVRGISLSPDGLTAVLLTADGIQLKNYKTWENGKAFPYINPLHAAWLYDGKLVVAGSQTISLLDPSAGTVSFIAPSQPGEYGFAGEKEAVTILISEKTYEYDPARAGFIEVSGSKIRKASTASEDFRVYLERQTSGKFSNVIMVRDIRSMGTRALFRISDPAWESFPLTDEPSDVTNFTHGSRIRRREVSLVFDAVDSSEGLMDVLSSLSSYNIKATFFVNGEFIRRYPDAVKVIAESGHEIGSLFSSYFDLTDERFKVDDDFIRKGLARNEDDYFTVTGRELSLFWHAPYYFVNSAIIRAAAALNYQYVGRDIDTLDWVSAEDKGVTSDLYYRSAELVERIMKLKHPGSILPIRIGKTGKDREDYLFQKVDLLINNLIRSGYSVVPISTLMDHAR